MGSPHTSRRRFLRAGGGLAASVGVAGCIVSTEPYTETVEQTFDPDDAEALAVRTDSGDVTLTAGDGDAVTGTIHKESRAGEDALANVTVEGRVEDGTLVVSPQRENRQGSVTVSLDLAVPGDLPVVEAVSENGDVSADGVAGDGTYRSKNGDVNVDDVDGFVTVESTNGDLSASAIGGLDGARTSNGDVTVDVPALRGDTTCRSQNGDVTAAVSGDLRAAVLLQTSNGDAETSGVPLTVSESTERRIEGRLDGSSGDGHGTATDSGSHGTESDSHGTESDSHETDSGSHGTDEGDATEGGSGSDGETAEHTLELRSTNGDVTLLRLGE
ncbi:DUF4097 family beta strand repeat-containing protein [Halosimplex sp. J119]